MVSPVQRPSAHSDQTATLADGAARDDTFRNGLFLGLIWLGDVFLLGASFGASLALRKFLAAQLGFPPVQWSDHALIQYVLCAIIFLGALLYEGVYQTGIAMLDQSDRVIKALSAGIATSLLFSFFTHNTYLISRPILITWYFAALLLFILLRPVILRSLSRPSGRYLLFVPGVAEAEGLADQMNRTILGADSALPSGPARANRDSRTIIIAPLKSAAECPSDLASWENRFGGVAFVPTDTDLTVLGAHPVNLYGIQIYAIDHPLSAAVNRFLKRGCDLLAAVLLLLLTFPFLFLIALAIRIDSPGPILFGHWRLGKNGTPFRAWKFRTMVSDAESRLETLLKSDPALQSEFQRAFKLKNDPRVTPTGKWLRRTSLDEIPQLWNVLLGEMSLIGPRPIVEKEIPMYGSAYSVVSTVRPGITGLWQISGRNSISYDARKHFDTYYVRRWSLWLDMAIVVRTIQALVLPEHY